MKSEYLLKLLPRPIVKDVERLTRKLPRSLSGFINVHSQQLVDRLAQFRAAGLIARRRVGRECTWDHYVRRFLVTVEAGGIELV
jgi:hypothetical protein